MQMLDVFIYPLKANYKNNESLPLMARTRYFYIRIRFVEINILSRA